MKTWKVIGFYCMAGVLVLLFASMWLILEESVASKAASVKLPTARQR